MTDRPGDGTAVTISRATNADILAEQEARHRVMQQTVARLEMDLRDVSQRLRDVERFKWQASAIGAAAGFAAGLLWELLISRVL